MPVQKNRIIIDTNLWISFLLSKDFSKLDRIIANKQVNLLFCDELLQEFLTVVNREKFKKYFDDVDLYHLLLKINNRSIFINITSNVIFCRDAKDDFLLSLAVDGNATHLITGDKDLLTLNPFKTTTILTMTSYLDMIK
jgi:putative PIN family toxin of toxin-antitoxin system